ncbi:P-loop containing nucleoside triphosphate hydrolase protein [Agrocybe pediades]|nr:P-loop containing nucleoside triphosphate hydrolase protein [Agrocybe pediades]
MNNEHFNQYSPFPQYFHVHPTPPMAQNQYNSYLGPPTATFPNTHAPPQPYPHYQHGAMLNQPVPPYPMTPIGTSQWYQVSQGIGGKVPAPQENSTSIYLMPPPGLATPVNVATASTAADDAAPYVDTMKIHDFWMGRLAPLPGYRSRQILLPKTDRKQTAPTSPQSQKSANQAENGKISKDFRFDVYAESFVPQYLWNIQKQLHPLKPLPAVHPFPSLSWIQSFLPTQMIEVASDSTDLSLLSAPPIFEQEILPPLSPHTYYSHWSAILRHELDAIANEKEEIIIWKIAAKVVSWKDSEFELSVPGIRENYPYLEIGDLVHLREVHELGRGRRGALEGRVSALRKREGYVHITSPPMKEHVQAFTPITSERVKVEDGFVAFSTGDVIPFTFNISFMTNARPMCSMERAVSTVAGFMNDRTTGVNVGRQWLFPEVDDFDRVLPVPLTNDQISEEQWADPGLNAEQRVAVSAVALYQSPTPHLISGPPGTGKTRTVVESVLQIFRTQPEACILLCAPSNPATDTLALRLQKHLLQREMLRLNDPNRTFAEVPDILRPYCFVENDEFSIPPWKELMRYRVIVCSCLDAGILARAHCTNAKLMALEEDIASSLHPHRTRNYVAQPHWTHLLIDEAAQGSEPELLIPISVVLPPVYEPKTESTRFMPQLTLCGDINQLGPHVVSEQARAAEFEVSLLERLFERPLYKQRSASELVQNVSSNQFLPYTNLVKNYRSHPVILMPPSAIFYNDTLQPYAVNGVIPWKGLANPTLPLKFIGTDAQEKSTDERASWFNPGQIDIVVDVIKSLLSDPRASNPPLRPEQIGVMAPWRKQVWTLRKRLRNEGLAAVDVGTVEDYQGRENRVVILSCVRSSARFLEDDHKKGMGLIFERKRMNVAITRAKELLVVVGNGVLMQRDPYWKSFLQFALRNGLYEGPDLSLEMDGNYISRLESLLARSNEEISRLSLEDQGLLLAGGIAREVLKG